MDDLGPEDLPEGFADSFDGRRDYLLMRIANGSTEHADILEREERRGFSTLMFEPVEGKLYDVGFEYYGEFICSLATARRLLDDGRMVVDGVPGTLMVATRFTNGVQMKWLADSHR